MDAQRETKGMLATREEQNRRSLRPAIEDALSQERSNHQSVGSRLPWSSGARTEIVQLVNRPLRATRC